MGKKCTRCGEFKTNSHFGLKSSRKDKMKSWCKSCEAVVRRQRSAQIRQQQRNWEQRNIEYVRKKKNEWREKNKERLNQEARLKKEKNRDYYRKYRQEYYEQNKD